ncbi:hypothetical protein AbraIFM66951_009174 [Aspergillus brasiliensis]|uniref:Uncharacterized protein n=1 Tax=Aspergillus brasiliensis TaxID=319629 RepID=A0A9W6DMG8_9EURO|nr:hypothetical protein AbraCBS73388_006483 [Aspergillus brasiliensis]GKZ46255.1 hypothetical protein AbraIFM66951_009174 [Aspergillus brasiliensis]
MDDTNINIKREGFTKSLSKALTNRTAPAMSPFTTTYPSSTVTSDAFPAFNSKRQKKRPVEISPRLATREAKRTKINTNTNTTTSVPTNVLANLKVLVEQLESNTTTTTTADADAADAESPLLATDNDLLGNSTEQNAPNHHQPWVDTALKIIKQGEKVYEKNISAFQDITEKLSALGEQVENIRADLDAVSRKVNRFHIACLDLQVDVGNIPSQEVWDITRLSLEALLEANAGDVDGCAVVKKELEKKDLDVDDF